jgi:transcriptional regulator
MYNLPHHKDDSIETVKEFARNHPFIFLTGCDRDNKPIATQVPVFIDEIDGRLVLTGHIMKNTDHHKAFVHNPNVLAVFTSPHIYVSATWYSNPYQGSTWNYMSVHAKGTIRFTDEQALIDILRRLTLHYEGDNPASTTVFDNLPPEYTGRLIKAIVAFEINITEIDHVFKLSQDRDEKSFYNIIEKLEGKGANGQFIADEMKKRADKLFTK